MTFIVLLGGARSGKSRLALEMATASGLGVTFLATATAGDHDMSQRITRHRAERPARWSVIEEPIDLAGAIGRAKEDHFLIVDCLTLWVTNLLMASVPENSIGSLDNGSSSVGSPDENSNSLDDDEFVGVTAAAITALQSRCGPCVVVTNEVGLGIVPATPLGRLFRDTLGRVNAAFVHASTQALLLVAGRALELHTVSSKGVIS